jgi:hypothetical protein
MTNTDGRSATVAFTFTVLGRLYLVDAQPADGSSVPAVMHISLTANHSVTWSNVTVEHVGGETAALEGGNAPTMTWPYATATPGDYVVHATLADGVSTVEAEVHFSVAQPIAGQTKLAMSVSMRHRIAPTKDRTIAVRVKVTTRAQLTVHLFTQRGLLLYTWAPRNVHAGVNIVRLRWPTKVRAAGTYRLLWIARSKTQSTRRTTLISVVGRNTTDLVGPTPEVVVDGAPEIRTALVALLAGRARVTQSDPDETFGIVGKPTRHVRVVVTDVDLYTVALVRDLRIVFPELRIVALSTNQQRLTNARKAGANVALPSSTPATDLALAVRRLLGQPRR